MEVSMNSNSLLLGLSFAGVTLALFALPPAAVAQDSATNAQGTPSIGKAFGHFYDFEIDSAAVAFRAVAAGEGTPEARAEALEYVGLIAWRYRRDWPVAAQAYEDALVLGARSARTLAAWSRMETARGNHSVGFQLARRAFAVAMNVADSSRAARRLGEAALAGRDTMALRRAHQILTLLLPESHGFLEFSRIALRVALRVGDGPRALDAWRSYYAAEVEREHAGLIESARRTLVARLPDWGRSPATAAQRADLAAAFANAAMFEEATIVATGLGAGGPLPPPSDDRTAEILLYADHLRHVEAATNEYYRSITIGNGDFDRYRASLDSMAGSLWQRLPWPDGPAAYDLDVWASEMRHRFRAFFRLVNVTGGRALWYGHLVADDSLTATQYGQVAPLRYLLVDGLVSDGFSGWAWDYQSRTGGSATEDYILQFRPAYAGNGGDAWWRLTDPAESRRRAEREAEESVQDWIRAERDPYGYLPGLAERIDRQGLTYLRDSLAASGLRGENLKKRFMGLYHDAVFQTSIFAHEGRHAIDRRRGLAGDPTEEKEFRAKLSQVAFAQYPRLAFGGIFTRNIGNATSHGQANLRIMRGLVAWMAAHATGIADLETDRPLLPQLDRLTDEQLRAAFRSMDPLAGG